VPPPDVGRGQARQFHVAQRLQQLRPIRLFAGFAKLCALLRRADEERPFDVLNYHSISGQCAGLYLAGPLVEIMFDRGRDSRSSLFIEVRAADQARLNLGLMSLGILLALKRWRFPCACHWTPIIHQIAYVLDNTATFQLATPYPFGDRNSVGH
jgi:hypothetical protein